MYFPFAKRKLEQNGILRHYKIPLKICVVFVLMALPSVEAADISIYQAVVNGRQLPIGFQLAQIWQNWSSVSLFPFFLPLLGEAFLPLPQVEWLGHLVWTPWSNLLKTWEIRLEKEDLCKSMHLSSKTADLDPWIGSPLKKFGPQSSGIWKACIHLKDRLVIFYLKARNHDKYPPPPTNPRSIFFLMHIHSFHYNKRMISQQTR